MGKAPSLVSLALAAIAQQLLTAAEDDGDADDVSAHLYEILPSDLFGILLSKLPPLALHSLQSQTPSKNWNDVELGDDSLNFGRRKRVRYNGADNRFERAWEALFRSRWPQLAENGISPDSDEGGGDDGWRQLYWQTHLQNCLDEAAELALLPSFGKGSIGEIKISDDILKWIGCEGPLMISKCSKLSYHCQQFGQYARGLRLPNVFCCAEMSVCCHLLTGVEPSIMAMFECSQLLRNSKLKALALRWIRSKEHVDGLCNLLVQNCETITSLEFIHCKLSSISVNAICASLGMKKTNYHRVQQLSIKTSSFLEINPVPMPPGLVSFLTMGRSLHLLKLCNDNLDWNFARMLFSTLIDACSSISTLDLSDNNIAGWLSNGLLSASGNSLQSLRVLNIGENNLCKDDIESLAYALPYMPNLEILDISDNPIGDDGIRCLIRHFIKACERWPTLVELKLDNCELSCVGVIELLDILSTSDRPLNSLSLADNSLGREVAGALGNFLGTSVKSLDIGGIGLGSAGFLQLQERMVVELKLVEINISKNRGGLETAKFLSKLISVAPKLNAVNAAYNIMPVESLAIICSALKVTKGNLERLDLTGNFWDYHPSHASMAAEFERNGRPILILPSHRAPSAPYDDDP